jgi:hypothetical protein
MTPDGTPDEDDELLLPWHAAGTLGGRDAERIERAIAVNAAFSHNYRLTLEERAETVEANTQLAGPSAGALERLLSQIEIDDNRPVSSPTGGIAGWIAGRLSRLGPRRLAWAAMAAALLVLVEAGLLGAMYASRMSPARYETASVPEAAIGVGFVPGTTVADVVGFAETYHVAIVDGPLAGGMFKMRVEGQRVSKAMLDGLVRRMQQESSIVRVVAVAE